MLEYKIVQNDSIESSEQQLNELSKYGWSVVSVTISNEQSIIIVLKRELEDPFKKR